MQARLHAALGKELRILAKVVHDFMPEAYDYEIEGSHNRVKDFDGRVDVFPVSDPNASTMSQRVIQYQAALQLAQQAPQIYDLGRLHRQMLEVLGIKEADKIVKLEGDIEPTDPVTENMKILQQEGVKAFAYQDHEAHIAVHMAMLQDPKIKELVGQSPFASVIQKSMIEHITEHVAFAYRKGIEIQLGAPLPDPDKPLPEDVEFNLSSTVAKAAQKLLQQDQAEMAQKKAQRDAKDPLTQIQQRELALEEAKFAHSKEMDIAKLQIDAASKQATVETERGRIASQERQEGARLGVKIASEKDKLERQDQLEGAKLGIQIAESIKKETE